MTRKQIVLGILGGLAIVAAVAVAQFVVNQSLASAFG